MFGGSTMFGHGVRDGYTIPSQLQRMLDAASYCAEVTNFGQEAYVSIQELLMLQIQVRRGNRPDLAIFYDGFNDTESAREQGEAGLPYEVVHQRKAFELSGFSPESNRALYKTAAYNFVKDSALGEMAKRIVQGLAPATFRIIKGRLVQSGLAAELKLPADKQRLARETVESYLVNKAIVEALAQKFGFQALFYWQPTIFDKRHLTAYEQGVAQTNEAHRQMYELVNRTMSAVAARNGVTDISGIFSDSTEPHFIDDVHIGEDGNRIIAARMLRDVSQFVTRRAAALGLREQKDIKPK
jgi:lysophospholipase L1-like esterase